MYPHAQGDTHSTKMHFLLKFDPPTRSFGSFSVWVPGAGRQNFAKSRKLYSFYAGRIVGRNGGFSRADWGGWNNTVVHLLRHVGWCFFVSTHVS